MILFLLSSGTRFAIDITFETTMCESVSMDSNVKKNEMNNETRNKKNRFFPHSKQNKFSTLGDIMQKIGTKIIITKHKLNIKIKQKAAVW